MRGSTKESVGGTSPLHYLYPRTILIEQEKMVAGVKEKNIKEIPPPTRVMLIFLDETESFVYDTVGSYSVDAFYQASRIQHAGLYCILISRSIVKRILQCKQGAMRSERIKDKLIKMHEKDPSTFDKISVQGKDIAYSDAAVIAVAEECDFSIWQIFAVNEHLLLFIPQEYGKLSDLELGIKRKALLSLHYDGATQSLLPKSDSGSSLLVTWIKKGDVAKKFPIDYVTEEAFKDFFVEKEQYKENVEKMSQWAFVLGGHGSNDVISNLPHATLQQILHFMNTQLITRFLFIRSCYAGRVAFNRKVFELPQGYAFPIVVEGIADEVTWIKKQKHIGLRGNAYIFSGLYDFALFSRELSSKDPIPYQSLLSHIIFDLTSHADFNIANFPSLQPAGRNRFFPLFSTITINETIAASRRHPLSIQKAWQALRENSVTNIPVIIIKADAVPFELDLRGLDVVPYPYSLCRIIFSKSFFRVCLKALRFDVGLDEITILKQIFALLRAAGGKGTNAHIFIESIYQGNNTEALFTDVVYLEGNVYSAHREGVLIAYSSSKKKYVKISYQDPNTLQDSTEKDIEAAQVGQTKEGCNLTLEFMRQSISKMESTLVGRYKTLQQQQQVIEPLVDFAQQLALLNAVMLAK